MLKVIGTFEVTNGMRVVACPTLPANSVATHTDNSDKTSFELRWRAPATLSSDFVIISFYYGIVQTGAVFWNNGISSPVFIQNNPNPPPVPPPQPTEPPPDAPPDADFPSPYIGCGSTKLCFGSPNNCIQNQNCQMFGGVFMQNQRFVFELFATRKKINFMLEFYLNPNFRYQQLMLRLSAT